MVLADQGDSFLNRDMSEISWPPWTDMKGQPIDLVVRVTDGYRKVDGNWLIAHEHLSVPVDYATGKPDLMSKP